MVIKPLRNRMNFLGFGHISVKASRHYVKEEAANE
jgi:hypothetical protein